MNRSPEPNNHSPLWSRISTNALVRFLLFFACGWAFVALFQYFEYVIFVFAISAILALILNYPVQYLQRFVKRSIALGLVIALSLIVILVAVVAIALTLTNQIQQLTTLLLQTLNTSNNPLDQLQTALAARNIPLNLDAIEIQIRNLFTTGLNWALTSLPILLQNYVTFIIILVVSFFMLIDSTKLWRLVLKLVPSQHRNRVAKAVQTNFVGFLRGQLLISFLLSAATFLVFVLFEIPFSFLLAVTIGVFDLIPGIGATLGVTVVCFVILVQSGWLTALKVLAVCVLLQQLQDNLLAPRVMQTTVHLSPVIVFFALLVGTRVSGLLGIFLSVPIAGVIVSLLNLEEAQGG
ncbi:MAG: AI-2E family transporter [Leptolyngbya sp. Prado105]|jgi:predicted PurR-regulated permease PerM|nr:AI-2E family transporter [Leptolyngbya sp. Prado105]